uniref:transketolase n=1 Tax=Enterocloster aldenensis TaxID=358742 RepID=UPI0022E0461E
MAVMEEKMKELKRCIAQVAFERQEGHIPSAYSILDILYVLYHDVMDIDPCQPEKKIRDRLIVSKGHASLGLYTILADRGYFPMEEVSTFGQLNSRLGGHPDYHKVPGVEASTGSLGHGLPLAVGIAMGLNFKGSRERVYVIVGDGEMNEGTNWEAIMVAKEQGLSNLVCIVDYNHSSDRAVDFGNMETKFNAFGWETYSVDGHNHAELKDTLTRTNDMKRPIAIIANTIKGYGCKMIENNPAWHHRSPNLEELLQMMEELA